MSFGWCPAGNGEPLTSLRPPLPSPSRTVTVPLCSLATTTSGLRSPLKSATSTLPGVAPAAKRELSAAVAGTTSMDNLSQWVLSAARIITANVSFLIEPPSAWKIIAGEQDAVVTILPGLRLYGNGPIPAPNPGGKAMNRNLSIFTITGAILVASLSQGCTTVKPNPADSTPPKVELKVKDNNGQWITQSAVNIGDE